MFGYAISVWMLWLAGRIVLGQQMQRWLCDSIACLLRRWPGVEQHRYPPAAAGDGSQSALVGCVGLIVCRVERLCVAGSIAVHMPSMHGTVPTTTYAVVLKTGYRGERSGPRGRGKVSSVTQPDWTAWSQVRRETRSGSKLAVSSWQRTVRAICIGPSSPTEGPSEAPAAEIAENSVACSSRSPASHRHGAEGDGFGTETETNETETETAANTCL